MKVRFQADANLDPDIGLGLQRRNPVNRLSSGFGRDTRWDAGSGRVETRGRRWPGAGDQRPANAQIFYRLHCSAGLSPGLLLVPPRMSIGETIEALFVCWLSWTAEEMQNQIRWLPRWRVF